MKDFHAFNSYRKNNLKILLTLKNIETFPEKYIFLSNILL